jgi:Lantibiotic dehydratase, N terminus
MAKKNHRSHPLEMPNAGDLPLIFRIAGWPLESIQGMRSPEFTAKVDEYLAHEKAIRHEAHALSDKLFNVVPRIADPRTRAIVLHLRRYLFRFTNPLTRPEFQKLIALADLPKQLRDSLIADQRNRRKAARQRQILEREYREAFVSERRKLIQNAAKSRFRKALTVASPTASQTWEGFLKSNSEALSGRLLTTLWHYVMRSVGRATPNSLWAGIAMEEHSLSSSESGIYAREGKISVHVKPDLNIFNKALEAFKQHPKFRDELVFRLNPTLTRYQRGWRFVRYDDGNWLVMQTDHDPFVNKVITTVRRTGPGTLMAIGADGALKYGTLSNLVQTGFLWPTVDWPLIADEPWAALHDLATRLPRRETDFWLAIFKKLFAIAETLSASWHSLHQNTVRSKLRDARTLLSDLLARYDASMIPDDICPLIFDYISPFRMSVGREIREKLKEAVRACYFFDRGGTGELFAREMRRRLNRLDSSALRLGGYRSAFSRNSSSQTEAQTTSHNYWEAEVGLLSNERDQKDFLALVQSIAARVGHSNTHSVSMLGLGMGRDEQTLPFGSALALLKRHPCHWSIRIGSMTADCGTFYSRFHHLFGPESPFLKSLRSAVSAVEGTAELVMADCAFYGQHDRNAALRPRIGNYILDPFEEHRKQKRVRADENERVFIHYGTKRVIPLINCAVDLSAADPFSAWIQQQAQLFGRPSLLVPLPAFRRELDDWGHLPRLELDGNVALSPERWHITSSEVATMLVANPLEVFLSWRRIVISRNLPALFYARYGNHSTESLLPADSVLAVNVLSRFLTAESPNLHLHEFASSFDELWLRDSKGGHYVAEIAVAWTGDAKFWREISSGRMPKDKRSTKSKERMPLVAPDKPK